MKVFSNKLYSTLAIVVMLVVFAFATWLPNIRLLFSVVVDPAVSLITKFLLPIQLLGSITTNFTIFSAGYTIVIAILAGVYVSLFTYRFRRQKKLSQKSLSVSFIGLLSGVTGLGCAACGSIVTTSLIGVGGLGSLALLPFKGSEFGVFGIVLLVTSIYLLAKQINQPLICKN